MQATLQAFAHTCLHIDIHSRAAQAQLHTLGTSSLNHPLDTRPTLSRSLQADSVQRRHSAAHDWPAPLPSGLTSDGGPRRRGL
jgi:hypothetical protein